MWGFHVCGYHSLSRMGPGELCAATPRCVCPMARGKATGCKISAAAFRVLGQGLCSHQQTHNKHSRGGSMPSRALDGGMQSARPTNIQQTGRGGSMPSRALEGACRRVRPTNKQQQTEGGEGAGVSKPALVTLGLCHEIDSLKIFWLCPYVPLLQLCALSLSSCLFVLFVG